MQEPFWATAGPDNKPTAGVFTGAVLGNSWTRRQTPQDVFLQEPFRATAGLGTRHTPWQAGWTTQEKARMGYLKYLAALSKGRQDNSWTTRRKSEWGA